MTHIWESTSPGDEEGGDTGTGTEGGDGTEDGDAA